MCYFKTFVASMLTFFGCLTQIKSFEFPEKYRSIGVNLTSLVPKEKTFDYYFVKPLRPTVFYAYYDTKVGQTFNLSPGFEYGWYRKINKLHDRALYIAPCISINSYYLKFNNVGQEYALGQPIFFSKIKERSINFILEPTINLSYQYILSKSSRMCFESGIGFNFHIFSFTKKEGRDVDRGYFEEANVSHFPLDLYLKIPLKIEIITKRKNKYYGIAIISQINDSYSIFNNRLRSGEDKNSVGIEHDFGFNSPTFLYKKFASNNNPTHSFNLIIQLSRKF